MPPCNKYLISGMPANLTLYYLITISTFIVSILIVFTVLISLFLYSFNNLFAFDLSDRRIEIDSFFEYDIFIVFTVWNIILIRLISVFNFSIRFASGILSNPPYLINTNLFKISVFFIFFLPTVLSFFYIVFIGFGLIRVYIYLFIQVLRPYAALRL